MKTGIDVQSSIDATMVRYMTDIVAAADVDQQAMIESVIEDMDNAVGTRNPSWDAVFTGVRDIMIGISREAKDFS